MPTNDFIVWAPSGGHVMTQSAYLANAFLANGVVTGIADSTLYNKSIRQSTIISSVVAQLIASTGANVIDDGTTATILNNYVTAIRLTVVNNANSWGAVQTHTQSIVLANNVPFQGKDSGGTPRNMLFYSSGNVVQLVGGSGGFILANAANTVANISGDDSGNYQIKGTLTLNNNVPLQGKDSGGAAHTMLFYSSGNVVQLVGGNSGFILANAANTVGNLVGDDSGNYQTAGRLRVIDNGNEGLGIYGAGTAGANLKLAGNGGTTPNKYIRANNGNLSFVNSAYSAEIAYLDDGGSLHLSGGVYPAQGMLVGGVSNPIANATNGAQVLGTGSTQIYNGSVSPLAVGTGNTSAALIGFFFGATAVATITTNGSSVAYNNNVVSDYRLKVTYGAVADAGSVIDAIPVYDAEYKSGSTHRRAMFLAHEFGAVIPDAVSGEKDAVNAAGDIVPQFLDITAAVPYLWADQQSLRQRVATLEAANAATQATLTAVMDRLATLEAKQ